MEEFHFIYVTSCLSDTQRFVTIAEYPTQAI
jgi:hypothetical protein